MVNAGTLFAGRYELTRKIGSGGMADVYEAHDTNRDILVALKILKSDLSGDESFVRRFEKEGTAASSLNNANIVSVYEVGSYGGYYYISMELVDGITLKEYIRRKGALTPRETMAISAQIAVGLRAAHAKHIIHRDVKPQNVILSREGKVKVTDFGIASLNTDETKTMNNNTMGSVQYISPEQAKGTSCDERSDIYSLGICMYEMITGRVPFDKDTSVAVALAHMNENMTPPSQLNSNCPRALEQIIFRCTQKSRERRYHNCTELLQDLRVAVSSPDFNFEKQEQDNLMKSNTQVFSEEETEAIRGIAAGRATRAQVSSSEVTSGGTRTSFAAGTGIEREADETAAASGSRVLFEEDMREDEKTILDRLLTVFGVFLGAAMVCMIIYISGTLAGWFRISTPQRKETSTQNLNSTSGYDLTSSSDHATEDTGDTLETFDPNHYDPETQTLVPNVVGLGITAATQILADYDLEYRISSNIVYSDEYKVGTICRQSYEEGTVVKKSSTIVLTLSAGTDKFEIKDSYVGGSIVIFRNDISRFGDAIEVEYVKVNSDSIPANTIISMNPSSGIVKAGDKIVVTFSGGPAYISVPNLLGMSRAEAISELTNRGLNVGSVTYDYSLEYETDKVMKQEFEEGELVENGGTVDIVVSNGPKIQKVPDLVNDVDENGKTIPMTLERAEEILTEMNFVINIVELLDENAEENIVVAQDPACDTDYAEGETVTITVTKKQIIRTVPNLLTKTDNSDPENPVTTQVTLDEARAMLVALGFENITVKSRKTTDASQVNTVFAQEPAAGSQMNIKNEVVIWVYSEDDPEETTESTERRPWDRTSSSETESDHSSETESSSETDPRETESSEEDPGSTDESGPDSGDDPSQDTSDTRRTRRE